MNGSVRSDEHQALEALLIDNPDLEQLEALLEQFNIFEAVGMVRQELRHSDFLAFMLNPQHNHGLSSHFLKRLLQRILGNTAGSILEITPLDLALWDLDEVEVRREWQNIDILLLDESQQFIIILENKVDSYEHSNQLAQYWRTVEQNYPGWQIIGLFLTPDGTLPSDDRYLPLSYSLVYTLLTEIVDSRASTLGPDVQKLIRHYLQMLKRHIMSDSEIADLCHRIYRKHQRALDLIFEHKPDLQAEIADFVTELVQNTPEFILDSTGKSAIRFLSDKWEQPALQQGGGWTASGRILLFELENYKSHLKLKLHIGPGPTETRQKLLNCALNNTFLNPASKTLNKKWNAIYVRTILRPKDYEETAVEEVKAKVEHIWKQWIDNDWPKIDAAIGQEEWY